jgi:hypothetical protein
MMALGKQDESCDLRSDNGPLSRCERFLTVPWLVTMGMLALIAGTASYLHTHLLLGLYGRPGNAAPQPPTTTAAPVTPATAGHAPARSTGPVITW